MIISHGQSDTSQSDRLKNYNSEKTQKATQEAPQKVVSEETLEEDSVKEINIDKISIKGNIPEIEKIEKDFNFDNNGEDDIDSLDKLLEIIEIKNDLDQFSDIKTVMEENVIIQVVDFNEIIIKNNFIEIEYTDYKKSDSEDIDFSFWNKIKEFANYYNS